MPRAHLCTSCGEDLALIAAERERHYAWPLVTCPSCAERSVRTEGADRRIWRRTRKLMKAIAGLLGRSAAFTALTAINLSLVFLIREETQGLRNFAGLPGPLALLGFCAAPHSPAALVQARADWFDATQNATLLFLLLLAASLTSVFIVVLVRHRRSWLTIPAWGAWLVLGSAFISLGIPVAGRWLDPSDPSWEGMIAAGAATILDLVAWCAAMTLLTLFTSPAGLIARGIARNFVRRQRWRTRKRILKRRQTA